MHEEVREVLERVVREILDILQITPFKTFENHQVWFKDNSGAWRGSWEQKPRIDQSIFSQNDPINWSILSERVRQPFLKYYPEYLQGLIGTRHGVGRLDLSSTIQHLIGEIIHKSYFNLPADQSLIQSFIQEFSDFFDEPKINFTYLSPLINFRVDENVENILLPNDLSIKRLNEDEITEIYGGEISDLLFKLESRVHMAGKLEEFAFFGEFEEDKLIDPSEDELQSAPSFEAKTLISQAVLALRSFKEGRVGSNLIYIRPKKFCPIRLGAGFGSANEYVPPGRYFLSFDEVCKSQKFAEHIVSGVHFSLQQACFRLATASTRINPQDKIVDSVIGLESILLAGLKGSELSYRFSLNYSTLFQTSKEKYQAFRVAKSLYNLRSTIAHGGEVQKKDRKIAGEEVTLEEASEKSCEVLREVIKHFLPLRNNPSYMQDDYWSKSILGLDLQEHSR